MQYIAAYYLTLLISDCRQVIVSRQNLNVKQQLMFSMMYGTKVHQNSNLLETRVVNYHEKFLPFVSSVSTSAEEAQNFHFSQLHFENQEPH